MPEQARIEPGTILHDRSGARAEVIAVDRAGTEDLAVARLPNGEQLAFPFALLQRDREGLQFAGNFHELSVPLEYEQAGTAQEGVPTQQQDGRDGDIVIPVIHETLVASKRSIDTGRGVRIHKTVEQSEQTVDLPLMQDEVEVQRVPRDVLLAEGETVERREEGDTLILPVLEEVLVVQKRVRLREEIHITRKRRETHSPQTVVLRSERVNVERFDESSE